MLPTRATAKMDRWSCLLADLANSFKQRLKLWQFCVCGGRGDETNNFIGRFNLLSMRRVYGGTGAKNIQSANTALCRHLWRRSVCHGVQRHRGDLSVRLVEFAHTVLLG